MTIYDILAELNLDNGSNYKMDVLRKHADNKLLQRVLAMTYDRVKYTYGVTMKNVEYSEGSDEVKSLPEALDILETQIMSRRVTGNMAINLVADTIGDLEPNDADVFKKLLGRDLKINMGRSNINKVFKNLIIKPLYMRCGLYGEKTRTKIDPVGAYIQFKADGTYREMTVHEDFSVTAITRSGEAHVYPQIFAQLVKGHPGHYVGELTVSDGNGGVLDRATGNGMINSDDVPHQDLIFDVWDYIPLEEYSSVANKNKGTIPYHERFSWVGILTHEMNHQVQPIKSHIVQSIPEALAHVSEWMNEGYEGGILKDANGIFRDGTSPQQLKLKLEIDAEVRITGFTDGTPGTKREKTFGAIEFETDDKTIKGKTSGFTDAQLKDFNSRREELIGTIMTVQFNDVTKARGNDFHALSHPRFIELRSDRDDTDTFERIQEAKEMAMNLS